MRSATSLLFLLTLVKAHGDHSFDLSDEDIGMSYAERHVRLSLSSPFFLSLLPLPLTFLATLSRIFKTMHRQGLIPDAHRTSYRFFRLEFILCST